MSITFRHFFFIFNISKSLLIVVIEEPVAVCSNIMSNIMIYHEWGSQSPKGLSVHEYISKNVPQYFSEYVNNNQYTKIINTTITIDLLKMTPATKIQLCDLPLIMITNHRTVNIPIFVA